MKRLALPAFITTLCLALFTFAMWGSPAWGWMLAVLLMLTLGAMIDLRADMVRTRTMVREALAKLPHDEPFCSCCFPLVNRCEDCACECHDDDAPPAVIDSDASEALDRMSAEMHDQAAPLRPMGLGVRG
jgi:hypothetical protein